MKKTPKTTLNAPKSDERPAAWKELFEIAETPRPREILKLSAEPERPECQSGRINYNQFNIAGTTPAFGATNTRRRK